MLYTSRYPKARREQKVLEILAPNLNAEGRKLLAGLNAVWRRCPPLRKLPIYKHITNPLSMSKALRRMTKYDIDIVSDVVCPWCEYTLPLESSRSIIATPIRIPNRTVEKYLPLTRLYDAGYVGHTRLSKAITNHKKSFPEDTFHLKYQPFYLRPPPQLEDDSAPPFPVPSRPRQEMYAEKFGAERAAMIHRNMAQVSKAEGLNFKFGGMTGDSRNGHRLVHYAQQHGGEDAQNKAMLGLWRRYFEQEVDITKLDVLVETGVEAGLGTEAEVKKYLESGEGGKQVDILAENARMEGISGVPNYTIQGQWEVSGGQDPNVFESLFKRWKQMEEKQGAVGPTGSVPIGAKC